MFNCSTKPWKCRGENSSETRIREDEIRDPKHLRFKSPKIKGEYGLHLANKCTVTVLLEDIKKAIMSIQRKYYKFVLSILSTFRK